MESQPHPGLDAMVAQVNPQAYCVPVEDTGNARYAWDVVIDTTRDPAETPLALQMARTSGGLDFKFEQRRLPVGLIARG